MKNWSLVLISFIGLQQPKSALGALTEVFRTPLSRTFYTGQNYLTISRISTPIVTISNQTSSLKYIAGKSSRIFQYQKIKNSKVYNFYFKVNPATGSLSKVGLLTENLGKYFSENCNTQTPFEKIGSQIKLISEFAEKSELDTSQAMDDSCQSLLDKKRVKVFKNTIASQFNQKDSYLLSCFSNQAALEKISKMKSLAESLPGVLDRYFIEMNSIKAGKPSFKIMCSKAQKDEKINASYDAKTKAIVFPIQDGDLAINRCHTANSVFSHEYLHFLGLTDEKQLSILDAVCAEANKIEGFADQSCEGAFTMKKCLKDPDSCGRESRMGLPEAVKQAVTIEAKKDRQEIIPVLVDQVQGLKLEDVRLDSASLQFSSAVARVSADGTPQELRPGEKQTVSEAESGAIRTVSVAMEKNFKKMTSIVDAVLSATVNSAQAAEDMGVSGGSKEQNTRSPASIPREVKVDIQHYLPEEVIADKFGLPLNQVQSELPPIEPSFGSIFNSQEILGSDYRELRGKLNEIAFIKSIENENIRIVVPREKKQVGSPQDDARVFIDTGRSFIRKR
jgi:hypothetical protein